MRRTQDARHVDQGVQAAEGVARLAHPGLDRVFGADVDDHGVQPAGVRARLGDRVGQARVADIGRHDVAALVQDAQSAGLADPRAGSGDEDTSIAVPLGRHAGSPVLGGGLIVTDAGFDRWPVTRLARLHPLG